MAGEGEVVFDRFAVVRELGVGAHGRVMLCRDLRTDELLALKELDSFGADALARFKREFRTLSDIHHPNLVRLGELYESDARWGFTLEYVPGDDAWTWVRHGSTQEGRGDEGRVRTLLRGLVAGLGAIHERGIVHRDVKPANVRVTPEGRVVLLDFGIATRVHDARGTDGIIGTPHYMAPEQAAGDRVTPAADWYAVGVMLYEALTGRVPFEGGKFEVLLAKQGALPAPPSSLVADVSETLERICMALLAPEPSARADGQDVLRMLGDVPSGARTLHTTGSLGSDVFVGRRLESWQLERQLELAAAGTLGLVIVEGESGIGKSALVKRFVEDAARATPAPLVLSGRCHAAERLLYKAFDSIVDELSRCLKQLEPHVARSLLPEEANLLPLLFPVLTRVPDIGRGNVGPATEVRTSAPLLRAFLALLRNVSAHAPLILTIDDLQWADDASLALLELMLEELARTRIFIVATSRPGAAADDASARRLAALHAHPRVTRMPLGRLEDSHVRELAARLLGRSAAPQSIERVVEEAHGHPLFVDELVRHAQEALPSQSALSLDAAIVARVSQLEGDVLRVLTVSCLAAGPLPFSVLAAASELAHEPLRVALSVLRARRLVRVAQRDETIFFHDRIREAVVQSQDPVLRASHHQALARAWAAETDVEPVRVAYHLLQAGDREAATPWLEKAAERAQAALAFDRAADLYRRALKGIDRASPHWTALCVRHGFALQHAGRREEAARAFEAAARTADATTRGTLLLRAGDQWLTGGFIKRGLNLLRKVGVTVPSNRWLTIFWAAVHFYLLSRVRSLRVDSRAVVDDERAARVDSHWTLAAGLAFVEPVQAMYFSTRGARLSLSLADPQRIARGLCGAGFGASALGMHHLSARLNALAEQAATHDGTPLAAFYARGGRYLRSFLVEHDWAGCVKERAELDALWRKAGLGRSYELDVADLVETWALANLGDLRALRARYDELVSVSRRGANSFLETALRVYHTVLLLADDDAALAEQDLEDALASWEHDPSRFQLPHAWATFSRGEIMLYLGTPQRRVELADDLRQVHAHLLDGIQWVRIRRDHLLARLALSEAAKVSGHARDRAMRDVVRRLRDLRAERSPASHAWSDLVEAGLHRVRGREPDARAALERSIATFERLGMTMYEQAARARLGQLDGAEGVERAVEARERLAQQGVRNVERMLRVLAPGWP